MKIEIVEVLSEIKAQREFNHKMADWCWNKSVEFMDKHDLKQAQEHFDSWKKFESKCIVLDDLLGKLEKKYLSSESDE